MCCEYNKFYTKQLIGTDFTVAPNNFHSVTIIATDGNPILQVSGSDDVLMEKGVSINLTGTTLIENTITVLCGSSADKAIIIYNN